MIDSFTGEYDFLSNFYPSPIYVFGGEYPTVEHAYQALKARDFDKRREIALAETPKKAKAMGRKVELRPGWDSHVKYNVMRTCLEEKFDIKALKVRLINTGKQELVEGNYWHDNIWGVCNCNNCPPGANVLGWMLMDLRDKLQQKFLSEKGIFISE